MYIIHKRKLFYFGKILLSPICDSYVRLTVRSNPETLYFTSLTSAYKCLTEYSNNYLGSFDCRGRTIKTFYDKHTAKFLYVDITTLNSKEILCNDCAETLCETIAQEEDKRIEKEKAAKKITIYEFDEG